MINTPLCNGYETRRVDIGPIFLSSVSTSTALGETLRHIQRNALFADVFAPGHTLTFHPLYRLYLEPLILSMSAVD